jgi:hypothetical protein
MNTSMESARVWGNTVLSLSLMAAPAFAQAPPEDSLGQAAAVFDPTESVVEHNLSGPRLGFTVLPDGKARSLFGWHSENQVASGSRGPWLLVERVFLLGGLEDDVIMPSFSLVFGMRMPSGFEFGVGPSVGIGPMGMNTAIVLAAGNSFRLGGIRMPVNLALTFDRDGHNRLSLVTGWAIREH